MKNTNKTHFQFSIAFLRNKRRFTLVELLIVTANIALLAGTLVPVINKAREPDKNTLCLSNLKTLGSAIQMYANDNGGWYKHRSGHFNVKSYRHSIIARIAQYVNGPSYSQILSDKKYQDAALIPKVFFCPSTEKFPAEERGYNTYAFGACGDSNDYSIPLYKSTSLLARDERDGYVPVSKIIIAADKYSATPGNMNSNLIYSNNASYGVMYARHNKCCNFLLTPGNCASKKKENLVGSNDFYILYALPSRIKYVKEGNK